MKNKTMLKLVFLSMVLSSCGLIGSNKAPEQPTDSKEETVSTGESTDDLFGKTMDEAESTQTDNPVNLSDADTDADLKSLEDEFSASGPTDSQVRESNIAVTPAPQAEAPVLVEEALPEIKTEVATPTYDEAGSIKTYKVQRGETLMQIAFKLYGDISKWKDIKNMNSGLSNNSSLKTNTELKYRAPSEPFVWNPSGTAYMIKTGETLGTISNTVYSTPKKWKQIWENNKPLIKNPNVIYAGFTLYYTNGGMANYVQPKAAQPKKEILARELARDAASREGIVEEVIVRESVTPVVKAERVVTIQEDQEVDEAIQTLSATKREAVKTAVQKATVAPAEAEIDLINNVSMPHENEIAPDIDEEIQTL